MFSLFFLFIFWWDLYNIKKCLLTKTEINDINLYSKGHNKRGDQKKSSLSLSRCFLRFFSLYFVQEVRTSKIFMLFVFSFDQYTTVSIYISHPPMISTCIRTVGTKTYRNVLPCHVNFISYLPSSVPLISDTKWAWSMFWPFLQCTI